MNRNLTLGSSVYIDGYTSMAQQNSGVRIIEGVQRRFDEMNGEEFNIYQVDGEWYDSRDGSCYSNKNSMYYLEDYDNV